MAMYNQKIMNKLQENQGYSKQGGSVFQKPQTDQGHIGRIGLITNPINNNS